MTATQNQIDAVISWGFQPLTDTTYVRRIAPRGYVEYWTVSRPEYIDFADHNDQFSHDYKIDWELFTK